MIVTTDKIKHKRQNREKTSQKSKKTDKQGTQKSFIKTLPLKKELLHLIKK